MFLTGSQTVLVIEDDRAIADTIVYALKTEGLHPEWQATGRGGLARLREGGVDLVLLDLGLPDAHGFDLLREIVGRGGVPVIIVTAREETIDRVTGLELGADDYIAKPFSPREVTARVRAVLRRCGKPGVPVEAAVAPVGRWKHDREGCRIAFVGEWLELTRYEYRLLGVLLDAPGRVFSRDQLMGRVWEDPGASLDRTVDAHIKTLRGKLRAIAVEADEIVTHRGLGYSLRVHRP